MQYIKLCTICIVTTLFSLTSKAGVQSYSAEQRAFIDGEVIGKKVIATCQSGYGKQEIVKKAGQNLWCGTKLPDVCSYKKAAAADLVCSRSYQRKATAHEAALDSDDDDEHFIQLKEELIEIDEQLLDIAQKMLDLKRQEMALKNST